MTNDLRNAFPTRPVRVLRHGAASSWLNYLLGLAFLAGGIAFAAWQVPTLLRDNEIRQNLVTVPDGRITGGKCRTRKAIFVECEATVSYAVEGRRYTHHPDIFFIDVNFDGYSTEVVRSGAKPELGTMSIAIDYFWDRVATVLGFAGLLVALGCAGFLTGRRNGRVKKAGSGGSMPLAPVRAELTGAQKSWGGTAYQFKAQVDGKLRAFSSRFGKDEAPLVAPDGSGIAVVPAGVATAILLDDELRRIDVSDEERQRIRDAVALAA